MAGDNTTDNTTWIWALLLMAVALSVQFAGFMNPDNAWLLHVAERVAGGAKLGKQVVESNPPLIIYIMELPVYGAKLAHMNPVYAFIIFIGIISALSLSLAFSQIDSERMLKLCLTFALVILPSWAFGEREHIFIILTLPYFVSLWRMETPGLAYGIISGLMAGIGFSLKPFFLLIWVVMILCRMVLGRCLWSFWSLQNIIIGSAVGVYIAYLVYIEKTYIGGVFPLLVKYYGSYNSAAAEVYKQSLELTFLCQVAFWVVYIKDRKLLTRAICFCSFTNLAATLLIIIQGKVWLNYFYPPNFFGFLSNVLLTATLFENLKPLWNRVAAFISSFILMALVTLAISTSMRLALRLNEDNTGRMIYLMDKYADGKPVYALTFDLGTIFPALLYSRAEYKGHFGHLWMLPGMYENQPKNGEELIFRPPGQRVDDETKVIGAVISDMAHNPPELVFVMDSKYYSRKIGNYGFDFIKYFSVEPEFAEIWAHYKKIGHIGDKDVYLYQH